MSKVTAKYQITIPVEVRKRLGIIPGTDVDIKLVGKQHVLVVNPINAIRDKWRGRIKDGRDTDTYIEQIRGPVE